MTTSKHLLLASLAVAGLIAASILLFIWPNYRAVAANSDEVQRLSARHQSLEHRAREVAQLEANLARLRQRIETEFKQIPQNPDTADIMRRLSLPVDGVTVKDQTIKTGAQGEAIIGGKSTVQSLPLTVDMESTFDSVFALIRAAERMQRLVRVSAVRIQCKRDKDQSEPPIVSASIGLEAIFDPPVAAKNQEAPGAAQGEGSPKTSVGDANR